MLGPEELPQGSEVDGAYVNPANPLWEYVTLGTIEGFKVSDDAQGLPIESQDMLMTALKPVMTPGSELLVVSPDNDAGLKRYNELRQMEADKTIIILNETTQYDTGKSGYIVWIRYAYVEYRLEPRFAFLREK